MARVHGRGKVLIPSEVRVALGLKDGDKVIFYKDEKGRVVLDRVNPITFSKGYAAVG